MQLRTLLFGTLQFFRDGVRELAYPTLGPILLGDIEKAPDAADDRLVEDMGVGDTIKDAAVTEHQSIPRHHLGLLVQGLHFLEKVFGIGELVEHMLQNFLIIPSRQQRLRNAPHLSEASIRGNHPALVIDNQDAVVGCIQCGLDQRQRLGQLRRGLFKFMIRSLKLGFLCAQHRLRMTHYQQ